MRLRQLILALIALTGVWVAVMIQRTHDAPTATALASRGSGSPRVTHVAGLERPVSVVPIVRPSTRPHVSTPARAKPVPKVEPRRAPKKSAPATSRAVVVPQETRSYAETPSQPLEPLAISDAQVVAVTSSSARITWRTNVPTQTQTAFGLDAPTIWAQPSGDSVIEHASVLGDLEFSTTYQVYLHAVDEWNRSTTTTLTLTTQPMPDQSVAHTNGDRIVVDDRPFFPTAVWAQCSDGVAGNISDGINLFMGDGCQSDLGLPARLDGRAYSIVNAENADAQGRGVIGWYFPDEWDAFVQSTVTHAQLDKSIPAPRPGRISFLTLTNHFYSRANPLPQGKGMYPVLLSIPDVVGFDLYPLQVWCRPAFGDVFDSQRELHQVSGGKPTFQWIEVAPMEHPCKEQAALDPTAATVRAETWLAIAGGAGAVGYFPNHWAGPIGVGIARTNREIKALSPALLAATATARSDTDAVKVSARTLNGALYVIAVNTTDTTVQAKIAVDGIAGRSLIPLGGGAAVGADDQGFSDTFGPLAARVYVIPPQGW